MNNAEDKKEVASDIITNRATPATKEAYDRIMDTMPGDNKSEKFKNLIKAVEEANTLTAKTGEDRSQYEDFILHTTRLTEIFDLLLKQKSELADKIRLDFQDQLAIKDTTISDLQTKVAEKEERIKNISEEKKDLEDQIKLLELIVQEVETAKEKALSAEESLKDSRMICATLQEEIAQLKRENEGYGELKADRDRISQENGELIVDLKNRESDIEGLKAKISRLETDLEDEKNKLDVEKTKYESEKDARKQDHAEHVAELARVSMDAVQDKDAAVQEARVDERQYWQGQIAMLQDKLDVEREKHAKERDELESFKLSALERQIAALQEQTTEDKETATSTSEEIEEAKKD